MAIHWPPPFPLKPISSIPVCDFCLKKKYQYLVNDDCIPVVSQPFDKGYYLCKKCYKKTLQILKIMNSMEVKDLPLYISHINPIIRNKAIKRLESV